MGLFSSLFDGLFDFDGNGSIDDFEEIAEFEEIEDFYVVYLLKNILLILL